jgi:hypothetical protein
MNEHMMDEILAILVHQFRILLQKDFGFDGQVIPSHPIPSHAILSHPIHDWVGWEYDNMQTYYILTHMIF